MLSALGLSPACSARGCCPVGTLYDLFIVRGGDALNYACYQGRLPAGGDAVRRHAGPEGSAHQSIGTPLIGMAQDGLCSFEPAFADELAVIMRSPSTTCVARRGKGRGRIGRAHLVARRNRRFRSICAASTRLLEQPLREMNAALARDIVDGAHWLPARTQLRGGDRLYRRGRA